jgi:REP element-mobilizing transposase RayT
MARAMRIAYPGAVYHIIDRGNDRRDIFFDDDDRRYYLDLLSSAVVEYRLRVYAYTLMSNHVHLFLRTLLPNISEVMYRVNIDYSHYFNKRHRRTGHSFGNRGRCLLFDY